MEAVAAMDFSALSRRELQALCKLNGVRANMTNLAMVEALHSLPSVDGIDQIGTGTLCLPTPGKSAMKSVLRAAAAAGEDHQQQGSPLPRGRRVSVKSPEAIRMDVEDGEDEMKRDLIKGIVRTPGVALRSTSRRPRATPAPIPTPAAGTLRRSQRSTARKATAPVEVEVATTKRSTRKTAKLNMVIDFDQDEEDAVARQQEAEPKGVTSDVKCDDPEEEEVTKLLEVNSKADEPEQGEEVVSCAAAIESVDKSCDNSKVEESVEEPTMLQEGAAVEEEQMLVNAEKFPMEDSPILGVLSKAAAEPAMKSIENASTEHGEGFGNWSPVLEIADEINSASEDKEDVAIEVPKEDAFSPTVEATNAPNKMIPAVVTEKEVDAESVEEYDLSGKSSDEVDLTEESSEEDDLDEHEDASEDKEDVAVEAAFAPNKMIPAAVTGKEFTADEVPQADPQAESADEYDLDGESGDEADLTEESSEEDDLDEEDMENANLTVDREEELNMLETGEDSDSLTGEEDDFSADLSSEFDSVDDFSDAETESNNSPTAFEEIHAAAPQSAAKTDDSTITEEIVSSEGNVVSQHVETNVKSLDKVTITEEKKEECAKEKKKLKVGKEMSLRKLKSAYKESLIAAKSQEGKKLSIDGDEGSRVALAELDDNVKC